MHAQPSDNQDEWDSSKGRFSFKALWADVAATGRRVWDRLREWWRQQTAHVEAPPGYDGNTKSGQKARGLATTARIAAWAPTAVVLALCEAVIATVIVFGLLVMFREDSVTVNRVLGAAAMIAIFGLTLLWFSTGPNAGTTTKRFWLLLRLQLLLLGAIAFAEAIVTTLAQVGLSLA